MHIKSSETEVSETTHDTVSEVTTETTSETTTEQVPTTPPPSPKDEGPLVLFENEKPPFKATLIVYN